MSASALYSPPRRRDIDRIDWAAVQSSWKPKTRPMSFDISPADGLDPPYFISAPPPSPVKRDKENGEHGFGLYFLNIALSDLKDRRERALVSTREVLGYHNETTPSQTKVLHSPACSAPSPPTPEIPSFMEALGGIESLVEFLVDSTTPNASSSEGKRQESRVADDTIKTELENALFNIAEKTGGIEGLAEDTLTESSIGSPVGVPASQDDIVVSQAESGEETEAVAATETATLASTESTPGKFLTLVKA